VARTRATRSTIEPSGTGAWKSTAPLCTVTTGRRHQRVAQMNAAWSIQDIAMPPKSV